MPQEVDDPRAWPALVAGAGGAVVVDAAGEVERLSRPQAAERFTSRPHLVAHAGFTARRLGLSEPGRRAAGLPAHADVCQLFCFVRPARPLAPSAASLARALGLPPPADLESQARALRAAASALMDDLAARDDADRREAAALAAVAGRAGWAWSPPIAAALGSPRTAFGAFETWRRLPEWEDQGPRPLPGSQPVGADEARLWLAEILGEGRERREAQFRYAALASEAFAPRRTTAQGHVVIAEAGTGTGKTLGYLAPATLWARRNRGTVWVSTFTKNLQRQIDQELDRVFPDPAEKRERVAILKGRENYLCLLNYDEAAAGFALAPAREIVTLVLVARWIAATRDGDLTGGDFPAWAFEAQGGPGQLTDRRGECVYAACRHYRRCFIERTARQAARAEIVVANHALVMSRAALNPRREGEGGEDDEAQERGAPARYVFDEGHHLFDAADGVFASHLTLSEGADLRRWLRGREGGRGRGARARGLRERLAEATAGDEALETALAEVERAAAALPGEGWLQRLRDGRPVGPFERFAAAVAAQVAARSLDPASEYSLECETRPAEPEVLDAAAHLSRALDAVARPMDALAEGLAAAVETAEAAEAMRLRATARGLLRRARHALAPWRAMLDGLEEETPPGFVDWFGVEREQGRDADAGFYRHHLDPSAPFAAEVLVPAHGALVTSATLRDRGAKPDAEATPDWRQADLRTGALHLALPATRASFGSPFDYAAQTRVFVVTDVDGASADAGASAYRRLFEAAGGGALGLFTSIKRLRAVHSRIAGPLEAAGLPLYAQHVDALDAGTLVDVFREDERACLLGTDALRDGVDVPGRSLRLIVFDRVPWPRPDILFAARKERLGVASYGDALVRLRLAQAFGRLVRRADDKGVFVILGAATPSRLLAGLPPGASPVRATLAEAAAATAAFLA